MTSQKTILSKKSISMHDSYEKRNDSFQRETDIIEFRKNHFENILHV